MHQSWDVEQLVAEHQRLGETITAHYFALDRIVTLSLLVVAGGVALGKGPAPPILVPMGLGLVALYFVDVLRQMMILTGYRRFIEDVVSEQDKDKPVRRFPWETWIGATIVHRSPSRRLLQALYAWVVLAGSAVSVRTALRYGGDFAAMIRLGVVTFWIVTWVAALVSALENTWAAARARLWAHEALAGRRQPTLDDFRSWRAEHARLWGLVPRRRNATGRQGPGIRI